MYASMADWFRLLTSNHLSLTTEGLNFDGVWILSYEEAIQLVYGLLVALPLPDVILPSKAGKSPPPPPIKKLLDVFCFTDYIIFY
jgi:hypothetical protein